MLGMFSCPSGAKVSWSRAPPPNVITMTFRFLRVFSPRRNGLALTSVEPSAMPAALRRKSRRLRLRARAVSHGVCGAAPVRGLKNVESMGKSFPVIDSHESVVAILALSGAEAHHFRPFRLVYFAQARIKSCPVSKRPYGLLVPEPFS